MDQLFGLFLFKWWLGIGFVCSCLIFYTDWYRGSSYRLLELLSLIVFGTLGGVITLLIGLSHVLDGLGDLLAPINFNIKGRGQK